MGRDALRLRHIEAGCRRGFGRRHHRLVPRQSGALQSAGARRLWTIAENLDRQGAKIRAARTGEGDRIVSDTAIAVPSFDISGEVVLVTGDRKSTRLNSSHRCISYAVFCLKKKKIGNVAQ